MNDQPSDAAAPTLLGRLRRNPFRRGSPPPGPRGRGDMLIAAAGLALAIGSALFPWYVFFNQEKFGIRALEFEGSRGRIPLPTDLVYRPELIGRPIEAAEVPVMGIDLLSTGTLPEKEDPPTGAIPLAEQPFPGEAAPAADYRLVHVANGRAMLEDENGLWVVQPGSRLPDDSRVSSIERRDGGWVIVTDDERIISIAN